MATTDKESRPHAAAAFMANLMQTGPSTRQGTSNDTDFHSEVQTYDNHFFDNMHLQVSQEIHGGEQLDSDVDSVIDDHDNTIPYHQYQLNNEVESVPTDVSSVIPGEISVITILDDLRSQLEGHIKTNEEQSFANDALKDELERYKTQVQNLEQSKVKKDLEQLVFERNKQNADLEEQLVSLKQQLLQHVESNKSLKTESEKLKADKNALEESYLEELVWLRNTNKVVTELLQSYGQPVQTVPMLSKRPTFSTKDLHKSALGHRNPMVYDSEETLVQVEVSRIKMLKRMKDSLCKVSSKPINYAKLNSLYDTFVPQKQLSREQVYWLPANEVASYNCNQSKPVTNFVRTRPAKSQVNTQLKMLKACFPEFDKVVKDRTTPSYITNGEWHFEHTKKCFVEEIIPFYEKLKTHVKGIEDNLFKEVSEYMKIFDELDKEYDQCVIDKKSLEIENKNLLIQNECLLAESVSKDICSVVLTSDIVVPMSVEPRSNCVEEHSRNLELEAEILKVKQLLVEKEKRCSFIETKYQELELKFQKYKECFENPQVCNNSSSPELNVFFEINKLKDQLQGKDELIRKLKAQIGNMKEVSADSNLSTLEFQALETEKSKVVYVEFVIKLDVSTSKTYQQSLAEAGSETRPPMLERGSYIPWASRFKRFLNCKRENRKWLLKALEDGPYVFRTITPTGSQLPRLQDVDDLEGDDLLYYDAEMELTNMILLSIPNEIKFCVFSFKVTGEYSKQKSGNVGEKEPKAYVQGEVVEGMNATIDCKCQRNVRTQPQAILQRVNAITAVEQALCEELSQAKADQNSDDEPSYESAFVSEVQSSSINENDEQAYPTHTKIINSTIDDDQINSNIQFDSVKGNVNSGSVEKDTHVYDLCALETLARNAYDEAAKQQRFAHKVQQQNENLISQIEMYKERNRVLENITKDNNYLKEFLEADEKAKRFQKQADSQLYRDREIIRNLEKQRDELSQEVKHFKQKNEELQQSQLILKRKMSENEDKYHDTILDLEEKLKKNVDMFLKIGNSLQAMFMLGPKPLQAISECPKLYVASRTGNIEIPLNVRDSEETLEEAFKSQQKMNAKMNDPIAVANKQNCWTIDYKQLNALYNDFVPQKESFVEQTCPSSSYTPFVKILETKTMPSELPLINGLLNIQVGFEKLFLLIKQNSKRASMFYTSQEEIALNAFCRDQVKPLLNELLDHFDGFQNLFQRDIKEMKDAFEQNDV
ncbi:hypothetical protein Tco_1345261 [Tanacetum coccineum]